MKDNNFRIIKASHGLVNLNIKELWLYRELFWTLALRNILIKYKQAAIGIAWAIIQPLLSMIVFSIIFGSIAKLPSDGVPYPLLTFTALLPWQFFASSIMASSSSVVGNAAIITKVYFPRLIIPASAVLTGAIDFVISFFILIGLMLWFHITPSFNIVFLPLFFFLSFMTALGIGLWLSALNVEFRDVIYAIPFLIQAGQYLSPVAYTSSIIPLEWRLVYSLNPVAGVIDGFRWCLLGMAEPNWQAIIISSISVVILFIGGLFYFRKMERTFADII